MKNKKQMIIIMLFLLALIISLIIYRKHDNNEISPGEDTPIYQTDNLSFDFKVINETNKLVKNQNYLISPLSMAFALKLLNEGADGNTKKQIEKSLNNYNLPNIKNVKDKIGIANLLFARTKYKSDISNNYIKTLQKNYSSDLLFDDFITPDKANEWINEKTYGMIPNAIENLSKDFILGLANTIAINVEWKNTFNCSSTSKKQFTKADGTKMDTAMMNSKNDINYIENKNAKGIIKDYKIYDSKTNEEVFEENENTIALEYIAILPNKDINEYLNNFTNDELNNLLKTKKVSDSKTDIKYAIPKYTYDYNYINFQEMLQNIGIVDAFDEVNANFKKMVNDDSQLQLYVSKSIHKTHIELTETGTKASAVTVFLVDKYGAMMEEKNVINIEFNKPFIFIIKEKNSDNIWFFGTVYEPIKWEDNKCGFKE